VVQILDLNAVDPMSTSTPGIRTHAMAVFETLYALDTKLRRQPMMVESSSVSADQLTRRFTLRPGLRFHDGQVVTTADLIPSLRR
jgi:peptide/nickel transport system substrate-binding protein